MHCCCYSAAGRCLGMTDERNVRNVGRAATVSSSRNNASTNTHGSHYFGGNIHEPSVHYSLSSQQKPSNGCQRKATNSSRRIEGNIFHRWDPVIRFFVPPEASWMDAKCAELGIFRDRRPPYGNPKPFDGLSSRPLKFFSIIGDGHCGFRSISVMLTGSQNYFSTIRRRVAEFVVKHASENWLSPHLPFPFHASSYLDRMLCAYGLVRRENYCTDVELMAAAVLFRMNILCYKANRGKWQLYSHDMDFDQSNDVPTLLVDLYYEHFTVVTDVEPLPLKVVEGEKDGHHSLKSGRETTREVTEACDEARITEEPGIKLSVSNPATRPAEVAGLPPGIVGKQTPFSPIKESRNPVSTAQTGEKQLIFGDFKYLLDCLSTDGTKLFYRCAEEFCPGRIQIDVTDEIPYVIREHTHKADLRKQNIREHHSQLKQYSTERYDERSAIITEQQGRLRNETRVLDPICQISHRLNNCKGEMPGRTLVDQSDLANIRVLESFALTEKGERFLRYDSRDEDPTSPRVLIFASRIGLQILQKNLAWAGNGTPYSCPKNFEQLYSVHALLKSVSLPCVFALLEKKDECCYTMLFRQMAKLLPGVSPTAFTADFEKAVVWSVNAAWPGVNIKFCIFHFVQSVHRNFVKHCDVRLYNIDERIRLAVRSLAALAFLPESLVVEGFHLLRSRMPPPLQDLYKYFKQYYISSRNEVANRNGYFPIHYWNVYRLAIHDEADISIALEGWQQQFHNRVGMCPALSNLIAAIKMEEDVVDERWQHYKQSGDLTHYPHRPICIMNDHCLRALCKNFVRQPDILPFLHSCSEYLGI